MALMYPYKLVQVQLDKSHWKPSGSYNYSWTQVFNICASGINLENFNAKFFNIYTEAVANRVKKFIYENL